MSRPSKSNADTGGRRSFYWLLDSSLARLQDPRTIAIVGTLTLRLLGQLDETWTAAILATAVGGDLTRGAMAAIKKLRGGK